MTDESMAPHGTRWCRLGRLSLLFNRRACWLGLALSLGWLAAALLALSHGTLALSYPRVLAALCGQGSPLDAVLILDIRLPRILAVSLAGAALGLSGCLIQTLVRNRLATPDMVGVNEGGALAIILFTLYLGLNSWPWWASPLGAVLAALALYSLCHNPGEQGYRFVVIGIALSELFNALGQFAMSSQPLAHLASLYLWSMGHFSGLGYHHLLPIATGLLLLCPALIRLSHPLAMLTLMPASARALGVAVRPLQLAVLGLAILVAALGTAIGGPVLFIAMAAPVLAAWLMRQQTVPLWIAALCGALLLLASDTLVRLLAEPHEIPTGIMTRLLGGLLLLGLLLHDRHKGHA